MNSKIFATFLVLGALCVLASAVPMMDDAKATARRPIKEDLEPADAEADLKTDASHYGYYGYGYPGYYGHYGLYGHYPYYGYYGGHYPYYGYGYGHGYWW